jgi:uncharacterized protein DUF1549/uncharacterized protein DUF1553
MKAFFLICLATAAAVPVASADSPASKSPSERWGDLSKAESPSFRRHVIPLVSRTGCNGRECHGAFSGQGGFSLSLFGYDFEKDHQEMTKDSDGGEAMVRIDAKNPEQSLLLLKATLQTKHKGKERFAKGSWEYNLMLQWIKEGARIDVEETGAFDRLEIVPGEIVFKSPGESVQLKVLAHWKDGTVEDVTQLTRFRANDDSVATVSGTGRVQSADIGDTHIVAFYDNGVQPIPVMRPVSDTSEYPKIAARTKVDELVLTKLRKIGIVPSDICTDAEFLRRACLDVTGTLPTPDEVTSFLADRSADKRARKIDELLTRPGYAGWFTTLLCDFTGNNPQQLNDGGGVIRNLNAEQSRFWYEWIYKRVAENMPYDQLAAGIILASTRTSPDQTYEELAKEMGSYYRKENPADFSSRETMPYFWSRRNVTKPQEKALAFSHAFLGVRIECAECHKHPFDQWTKHDFEQFQVFFTTIAHGANRVAKDQGITYASLTEDIRAKVMADRGGEPFDKKDNGQNKLMQQEALRRLLAGELVPWNEVYVDARRAKSPNRKNGKEINGSARVLTPKILGGEEVMLQQYSDPREPLMDWMRSKDNPYFSRALVNRIWANYFGRGIVEPADDMNLANPPVNKELMDYLAEGFVARGFDLKWLHREILNSDAYQRSWKPNDTNKHDEKNFSRMVLRRLPAEVAIDAIKQATTSSADLARFAVNIPERAIGPNSTNRKGNNYALSTFGKPARVANCDCERTADPTLLQTLFTRNDPELLGALDGSTKNSMGWIGELRRAHGLDKSAATKDKRRERLQEDVSTSKGKPLDLDAVVNEAFLRTLSRPPTAKEVSMAKEDIGAARDPVDGVRDVLWALLNTREFLVNH